MNRILLFPMLAAHLATAAVARPADISEVADLPAAKSIPGAYGSMLLGIAGPMLLGTALVSQEGETYDLIGGWLIAGGVFLGPSTGQFYAESYGSGLLAAVARLGGAAIAVGGFAQAWGGDDTGGSVMMLIGAGTFAAGGLYSLIDTKSAVDRYWDQVRTAERFGLTPTLTRVDEGEWRPGALAWVRF